MCIPNHTAPYTHNLCAQCVSSDFMLLSQVSRSLKVFVCFRVLSLSSSFWWCCAVFIISFDVTFSESFMFDLFLFYLSSENHPKYLFELFLLMVWTVWQWFPNGLSKHINTLAYIWAQAHIERWRETLLFNLVREKEGRRERESQSCQFAT